jgi:DNA-binding LytR/AlgR family response regulator
MRVIVVDDEPLARGELIRLIGEDETFHVVGEASNGQEALELIEQIHPDVVFLDIDMPKMNGLEVASRLSRAEKPPILVFATAYHQHAVEAFELNAVDYVLKPYETSRLQKTFQRLKAGASKSPMREKLQRLESSLVQKGALKKLVGHNRNRKDRIVIHPEDVFYFHAHYAEVTARLADQELIVNAPLKDIAAMLDPDRFAQTHKAYLVNLDKVEKVSPMFSGNFEMTLKGLTGKLPLSRRYARRIKELLGTW